MLHTRLATDGDLWAIKQIANRYKNELGYVMWPALRESMARGTLLVAVSEAHGGVVGFVNYRARKDGWHTIYEIAVVEKQRGIGRALLDAVPRPTRLKCTVDNDANEFYARMGFDCVGTEEGRKRALNVWVRV